MSKSTQQRRLEEMQAGNHERATNWWRELGLDLHFLGVDLGECIVYRTIEAINTVTRQEIEGGAG
jgi:hypothetical protein